MSEWTAFCDQVPPVDEPVLLWSPMWEETWGMQLGTVSDCGVIECPEGEVDSLDPDEGPFFWRKEPETPSDDEVQRAARASLPSSPSNTEGQ